MCATALVVFSFATNAKEASSADTFKELEWSELMPPMDRESLLNSPIDPFSSFEDTGEFMVQDKTFSSVVPELDGESVKIPGFIVPLEFDDDLTITQFFLVPYFGACVHAPPPPPNQLIFVDHPEGIQITDIYTPYWLSGVLKTTMIENEMAAASYSLQLQVHEEYTGW